MSIQIKRGMKKDLPQLKDGELAFCRDTKELYVGNNGNENVSVTKKVEDRLDVVDSQLEYIVNNTIFIKNDVEDLGEFINNISGDFNKIVLLGEYNIYSPVTFSKKNNLIITGKCKINICKDLDYLFTFDKCSNLLIDGLEIDGNNKECYKVINLIECENSKVENCNIKNIKNLNVNEQSSIIKVLSNNFNISNIEFKNIKSYAIQENEGSGKGSLQCIYILIHEDYRKGKIENVNAYNISNIDKDNRDIVVDVDVILSQYSNGGLDANPVDSMLIIENIYGYDYGKRVVKLQTSGVNVEKIKGKYENLNDGYCLISIHNTDVNVKNAELITINNDGSSCFIDTGQLAKNINIQNIKFTGKCRTGVIQIGNGSRLNASDNIIIDNFTCNATARELISIQHTVTNIIFKNFSVIGEFNTDMIKINSYTLTFKVEYKLIDSKIDIVCPTLFQYTTSGDLGNIDFINSSIKIDMMGESGNVFALNVLDGEVNIKNTNIVVNNASYMWGLLVVVANKINIENSSIMSPSQINSGCVITRLFGNNVNIYNFTTDNKRMTIRGFNTSINKCINCNRILLEKLDGISEQHNVSILNYSNEVYTNNNSDYNFINSDTFVLKTTIKLSNGYYSGSIKLPYRMTSIKVLNCYTVSADVNVVAFKGSGTSYDNIDIRCKHNNSSFNSELDVFIIYQR